MAKHDHTVTGHIFETKAGTEALWFDLDLGFIKLKCIANIPEEDRVEAPVFVRVVKQGDPSYEHEGR